MLVFNSISLLPLFLLIFTYSLTVVQAFPPDRLPNTPSLVDHLPPGEAFIEDADFNAGRYGGFVTQTFKSTNVTAPRLNMQRPFTNCDDGSYLFVTPRGTIVDRPTAAIYDASGSLIWITETFMGQIYNFQVQQYNGSQYLIFWAGNDSVGGHGAGHYYMYDQHYNLVRNISASNGLAADLHSFTILPGGNALTTAYEKVRLDENNTRASPSQPGDWIWESLFQEYNLETGELVFQWRAIDHVSLHESYAPNLPATALEPWDWFHINMVEKDDLGNYLVSARHTRSILYIDGRTGDVLWRIGGKNPSFEDLSDGEATLMVGQHDAHWDEGHRFITFFDNRADWVEEVEHVSKGRRIEIDLDNMRVTLNHTFVHPMNIFGFSQGSYQTLATRNVLLGYGYTAAFAEFAPNGTLLCDAYIQPSSRFSSGDVQSYRNMKFNWTGKPLTQPKLVLEDRTVYVSWLGSTEVRSWQLQDAFSPDDKFKTVQHFSKTGFETEFVIPAGRALRPFVRVVALDNTGQNLAVSNVVYLGNRATLWPPQTPYLEAAHIIELQTYDERSIAPTLDYMSNNKSPLLMYGAFVSLCGLLALWVLHSYCNSLFAASRQRLHSPMSHRLRNLREKQDWKGSVAYDMLPSRYGALD